MLEFRLTEQIVADDGHQLTTFLERTHTPHDIAFLTGPDGGFHHLAYWVDEWNDLRTAADTCAYHGVQIDAGPTRHGATRGCGLYFFDPAGNRNEVYTGGYHFDPDDEPTTWTEAEMGRAIFTYKGQVDPQLHVGALMTNHDRRRSGDAPTASRRRCISPASGNDARHRADERDPRTDDGVAALPQAVPRTSRRRLTRQPHRRATVAAQPT